MEEQIIGQCSVVFKSDLHILFNCMDFSFTYIQHVSGFEVLLRSAMSDFSWVSLCFRLPKSLVRAVIALFSSEQSEPWLLGGLSPPDTVGCKGLLL